MLRVPEVVVLDRPLNHRVAYYGGRRCVQTTTTKNQPGQSSNETRVWAAEGRRERTETEGDGKVDSLLGETAVTVTGPVREGAAHRLLAEGRDDCTGAKQSVQINVRPDHGRGGGGEGTGSESNALYCWIPFCVGPPICSSIGRNSRQSNRSRLKRRQRAQGVRVGPFDARHPT